ncbi:MAG: Crp/Fnr family transcriptional regulator [Rhodospirillaceae bacterium]
MLAGTELVSEFENCAHVFVVLRGWMALKRILEDGRQQILDFALPGAFVGDPTGRARMLSYSIEAVTDSEVAVIPLSRLPDLLRRAPSVALTLMQSMQDSLANAYDSLTDVGRRSAREAVANFLFRMDGRIRAAIGERADGSLEFPLTQENIGDALGLTAVHVCRTLRTLGREGVVCAGRKGLMVHDRDRLAEIAGVEPVFVAGVIPGFVTSRLPTRHRPPEPESPSEGARKWT